MIKYRRSSPVKLHMWAHLKSLPKDINAPSARYGLTQQTFTALLSTNAVPSLRNDENIPSCPNVALEQCLGILLSQPSTWQKSSSLQHDQEGLKGAPNNAVLYSISTTMLTFTFISALLALLLPLQCLAHNIQLSAHTKECFHENLHRDDKMTVTFQVGDREFGGSGNLEIDFWVRPSQISTVPSSPLLCPHHSWTFTPSHLQLQDPQLHPMPAQRRLCDASLIWAVWTIDR